MILYLRACSSTPPPNPHALPFALYYPPHPFVCPPLPAWPPQLLGRTAAAPVLRRRWVAPSQIVRTPRGSLRLQVCVSAVFACAFLFFGVFASFVSFVSFVFFGKFCIFFCLLCLLFCVFCLFCVVLLCVCVCVFWELVSCSCARARAFLFSFFFWSGPV